LTLIDWAIVSFVLAGTVGIGFYTARRPGTNGKFIKGESTTKGYEGTHPADDYIVSNREVGLFAFVAVNVSTWYGGILGIGEYSYRYGISSWFTQGFPYYLFALIFALFFAEKIRKTRLATIPAKMKLEYGRKTAILAAILVFILTSPAPYLLTAAEIVGTIFGVSPVLMLFIIPIPLIAYLSFGGFRSNIKVDVFLFFFMFAGFVAAVIFLVGEYGSVGFLEKSLPADHLSLTGGSGFFYLLVWYLVASWTIADPGFHQRVYSARSAGVAKKGILISIILWFVFDFFTNTSGLFARALEPGLSDPVSAFPILARDHLPAGVRGLFLASMFATVYTTLNSFIFLSGVTFSNDIVKEIIPLFGKSSSDKVSFSNGRVAEPVREKRFNLKAWSGLGMLLSTGIAIFLCLAFRSIIDIWFYIGSLVVPALIFLILGAYFPKLRLSERPAILQSVSVPITGGAWIIIRSYLPDNSFLVNIEPMIVGLFTGGSFFVFKLFNYRGEIRNVS